MPRAKASSLLLLILACLSSGSVDAQGVAASLRLGQAVERSIAPGETHAFSVRLDRDQFLQAVVDQHDIELVVRVVAPDGKRLGEFDTPGLTNGAVDVSLITEDAGLYRIEVLPQSRVENAVSGLYEIRILSLRPATREELESASDHAAAKSKAIALLARAEEMLQQIRLPATRIRTQIRSAKLLRGLDDRSATRLIDEAIAGVNQYLANLDLDDPDYDQSSQTVMELRTFVAQTLASDDPELALNFLRATHGLGDPDARPGSYQESLELQLELSLATRIAAKDPKRTLQIAQEALRNGYSSNLIDSLSQLQKADPESAAKLAGEMSAKLQSEDLLKNQMAASLVARLLQVARPSTLVGQTAPAGKATRPLLFAERQYRELLNKALSAALTYTPPAANFFTPERNAALCLLDSLRSLEPEMERYAPGQAVAVEKAYARTYSPAPNTPGSPMQQIRQAMNSPSTNVALEAVGKAPEEMRAQLYRQLATRVAGDGNDGLARQIVSVHVANPFERQLGLKNLDEIVFYNALNNGKLTEALEILSRFRAPKKRAAMLITIVQASRATQKRETLLGLLDQARGLAGDQSGRAENQEQMNLRFEIARAYMPLEPKRSFEIIETVVEQFNEMGAAAVLLNGFGQKYLNNGELMLEGGNGLASLASQMMSTLGVLACTDFDRAKGVADKLQRVEVRLAAYMSIAQQTITRRR